RMKIRTASALLAPLTLLPFAPFALAQQAGQTSVATGSAPNAKPAQGGVPPGHQKMLDALHEILLKTEDENPVLGSPKIRDLKKKLAEMKADAPVPVRFQTMVDLADAMVYYGDERQGLDVFKQAFALDKSAIPNGLYNDSKVRYAAAWMRLAE